MMAPDAQRLFRQAVVAAVTGWPLGRNDALALLARLSDLLSGPARDALCAELAALDRTQDFQTFWSGLERVRASLERMCEPGPEVQSLLPLRERSPEAKRTAGEGDSSGADTISWQPPALPGTLLSDFFAEVSEHLDAAAHLVLGLTAAGDPGVQELYRHLHTVKGNSGMVGLTPLKDVTHRMEDVVKGMRDGTLTFSDPIRQVLADGVELAQGILEAARRGTGARLPVQTFLAHAEGIIAQPELRASPDPCGPLSPNGATAEKGTRLTAQGGAQRNPVVAIAEPVASRLQSPCKSGAEPPALSKAEGPHSQSGVGPPALSKAEAPHSQTMRVGFEQVDRLAMLVGEQAVRREEMLRGMDRLQERVEEMGRRLLAAQQGTDVPAPFLEYLTGASRNVALLGTSLEGMARQLDVVSGDLQRSVLDLRMVPLAAVFEKHAMTVHQAARAQGKRARLVVEAGDAKIDKSIAERLDEPLMHLFRNAVSHGLQDPQERAAAGKGEEGLVTARAQTRGSQVVVQVEDDGVGILPDLIRCKAVEKGFLTQEEAGKLDDEHAVDLIFAPGFSTTTVANDVSGRGVGLDVVRDKVNRLNGAVQVFSQPGRGTTFQLTLPLTLAVAKVLLVEAGGEWVALPADLVERVEVVDAERLAHVEGRGLSTFSGEVLPLVSLAEFLDLSPVRLVRSAHTACLVRQGKQAAALLVDRVVEHTQAVIRDLGPLLPHVAYCMGVTFYEGRALLIVDVGSLLRALPQERTADAQAARIVVVTDAAERFAAWHRAAWDLALPLSLVAADATRFVPLAHARVVAVDGRMTGLAAWLAAWSGRLGAAHRVILAARDTARELDLAVLYRSGFGEVLDPADVPALLRRLRLLAAHDEGTP